MRADTPTWLWLTTGLILLASGFVLATSWAIVFPAWVVGVAALVALIAAVTAVVMAWMDARRSGLGFFAACGHGLRALGRFIRDFF